MCDARFSVFIHQFHPTSPNDQQMDNYISKQSQIALFGADGELEGHPGLAYDDKVGVLSVARLGPFKATGTVDMDNNILRNVAM